MLSQVLPETVKAEEEALVKLEEVALIVPLTAKTLEAKVKFDEVAMGLMPLPNRMSLAAMDWEPVPPFATGRIPATFEVKSMDPAKSALVTLPTPMVREL